MNTESIKTPVDGPVLGSRLPAGSTLEVAPGVHVPHPHAEVNLPGYGDPRVGDTKAVTEFRKAEPGAEVDFDPARGLEQKPLADEVRPKVLTAAESGKDQPTTADVKLVDKQD